jgi:3-oxoacyl-[acyl-carrier protein] reductase
VGDRLAGRSVVVTGAASGIGRATAALAVLEGADVVGIDVQPFEVPGVSARRADVTDAESLGAALADLGRIDAVLANAGVLPPPVPVERIDMSEWHGVLDVNLTGVLNTFRAALPTLVEGGVLLATGSSLATRPREERLAYVASKAGLHAMCRALALELAPRRIRVNVIAPGLTDTSMVHRIPGHVERGLPSVPLGALVSPEEVAALAVHLMSDDARSITGAVLPIDGGRTAG